MLRKSISLLISLAILITCLASCGGNTTEKPSSRNKLQKKYKVTASTVSLEEGDAYKNDALLKEYEKKYNIDLELIPLSWSDWVEKTRVWISSGDMPDITFTDVRFGDYNNFIKQGLIKALPSDYAKKYPNLASSMDKTGIADYAKKQNDGKLYMVPKVTFLKKPYDPLTTHFTLWYRKDWAQKVGMDVKDYKITFDQISQMSKAFQYKDPGENGKGKTVGVTVEPNIALTTLLPYNINYDRFYLKNGKYVWGAEEKSTLEGLKYLQKWYQDGTLYKDFYTFKSGEDAKQLFYSGKSGLFMEYGPFGEINKRFGEFEAANPGKDADDCLGLAAWTGNEDNKHYGIEAPNYWACSTFNPKLSDDKFDRILSMMDDVATQKAQDRINLGVEGTDYKKEGNKIVITREKDSKGQFKPMQDLHKSYFFFAMLSVLWDNFGVTDPSIPDNRRELVQNTYKARGEGVLRKIDYFRDNFTGRSADKFQIQYKDEFIQLILKPGSLENNWKDWVKSKKALADICAKEISDAYAKQKK